MLMYVVSLAFSEHLHTFFYISHCIDPKFSGKIVVERAKDCVGGIGNASQEGREVEEGVVGWRESKNQSPGKTGGAGHFCEGKKDPKP